MAHSNKGGADATPSRIGGAQINDTLGRHVFEPTHQSDGTCDDRGSYGSKNAYTIKLPSGETERNIIIGEAKRIINGDRQEAYGSAADSFSRIAELWSTHLDTEVTATDVALMLVLMKVSRTNTSPGRVDNWVDIVGYAALGGEIAIGNES